MTSTADTVKKQEIREWPNSVRSREELDAALEEGANSGISERSGREIVDRALERLKNG